MLPNTNGKPNIGRRTRRPAWQCGQQKWPNHHWGRKIYIANILNKSPLPLTDPRYSLFNAHRLVHMYMDNQCDKLVIDDRHQFIKLTVQLIDSTWDDRRDISTCSLSRNMVDAHQNKNGLRDLTMFLSGTVCHSRLALATVNQPTKFEVSISLTTQIWKAMKMSKMGWFGVVGSLKVTGNSAIW